MSRGRPLFWGLIIGTAVGVAIGMLAAPRTGKENREWTREHARDWYSRSRTWWEARKGSNGHREHMPEEEIQSRLVE